MPLLNTAKDVKWGTTQVQRVYRGTSLVWQREIASGVVLSASKTQINSGESITLTATITDAWGTPVTAGSVRFRSGSTTGTIISTDTASPWTATVSPTADTTYYAEYLGDGPNLPAFSTGLAINVAVVTTVVLTASKTSINAGEKVTLTGTVNGGAVTAGTVQFRSGSASGPIVGTDAASPWSVEVTPTGDTTYFAEYLGTADHMPGVSAGLAVTYTIPTTISLAASTTSVTPGQGVTLTATLTGASTGTVQFRAGSVSGTVVASAAASGGRASAVIYPNADTTYFATYAANGDFGASNSSGVAVNYSIPTSILLQANTGSVASGGQVTLTAYTTSVPIGHTISFRAGSPTGAVVGTGVVVVGGSDGYAAAAITPSGDTTYYATYAGSGDYLASNSGGVFVDFYVPTSTGISVNVGTINNGQSVTVSVSTTGSGGTIHIRAGGTTGPIVASIAAPGGSAVLAPTASTTYFATYTGNGDYQPSNSGGAGVTVRQLVTKTWSGYATWSQSYKDDNGKRTDTTDLYYGYYSSTWGQQKSLIGFSMPSWSGVVEIVSVRLKFYNEHHYQNSGGDIPVSLHVYSSEPSTWGAGSVDNDEYRVTDAPKPGWVDFYFGATARGKFKSQNVRGVGLGPAPSSSTSGAYYGYASGHSASNKPWLEVKYTVWE